MPSLVVGLLGVIGPSKHSDPNHEEYSLLPHVIFNEKGNPHKRSKVIWKEKLNNIDNSTRMDTANCHYQVNFSCPLQITQDC